MKAKYIIEDSCGIHCFTNHSFKTYEDAWSFIYCKFPVIYNEDGTQDDRESELDEYYVVNQ
jgi:hypothetical protein